MARLFEPLTLKECHDTQSDRNFSDVPVFRKGRSCQRLAFCSSLDLCAGRAGIVFTEAAFISNSATQRIGNDHTEFH